MIFTETTDQGRQALIELIKSTHFARLQYQGIEKLSVCSQIWEAEKALIAALGKIDD